MEIQDHSQLTGLSAQEMAEIRRSLTLQMCEPHDIVFREGAVPDAFYLIEEGQVLVSRRNRDGDEEPLDVLEAGEFFGETGLLEEMPRTATAMALTTSRLLRLSQERFRSLLAVSPSFSTLVTAISRTRLLQQNPLFKSADSRSLLSVAGLLSERSCPEETVLVREGDPPDALYVIIKGGVQVMKQTGSGKEIPFAHLGQGDSFGEMGLVDSQPRSATVVTTEPSTVLILTAEAFQTLLRQNPLISLNIARMLSQRLRDVNREAASAKGASYFKGMTIITRPERCLSCRACEMACAVSKSRTGTLHSAVNEQPLPIRRIHVRKTHTGPGPQVRPEHCLHCRNAPCLAACKLSAITRDLATGTIVISGEKCKGCGLCAKACPFGVITVVRSEGKRRSVLKCTYCAEHQSGPACVRSCPTHALVISLAATPLS